MRLHSAMGLFLKHKTLTDKRRNNTNWVRADLGTSLIGTSWYWVRVDWHPPPLASITT